MKDCGQCRLTMKRGESRPYKWQGGQMKNLPQVDRGLRKKSREMEKVKMIKTTYLVRKPGVPSPEREKGSLGWRKEKRGH
jgi:hypothetical protein